MILRFQRMMLVAERSMKHGMYEQKQDVSQQAAAIVQERRWSSGRGGRKR